MGHYVKTFDRIFRSTIWQEDSDTRIVWWTMLLLADRDGNVHSTIPGLAHTARVSLRVCKSALDKFLGPDEYSDSQVLNGQRLQKIDGGWFLVNFFKYREMMDADEQAEKTRLRVAAWRARKAAKAANVTPSNDALRSVTAVTRSNDIVKEKEKGFNPHTPKSSELNSTEVAIALCQEQRIIGYEERAKFGDAIKAEAEGGKRIDLPVVGQEIMESWLKHRATGKFPQAFGTFLANGLHKSKPSTPKSRDAAKIAREQLEEQRGHAAGN